MNEDFECTYSVDDNSGYLLTGPDRKGTLSDEYRILISIKLAKNFGIKNPNIIIINELYSEYISHSEVVRDTTFGNNFIKVHKV